MSCDCKKKDSPRETLIIMVLAVVASVVSVEIGRWIRSDILLVVNGPATFYECTSQQLCVTTDGETTCDYHPEHPEWVGDACDKE